MREFRMGANTTEHYSSFQEAAKSWGCRPITKQTKDKQKLEKQRIDFCAKHRCRACNQSMTWIEGTSTMICANEKCRGIKYARTDKEGNENVIYLPSYDLLDSTGFEIACNLFS